MGLGGEWAQEGLGGPTLAGAPGEGAGSACFAASVAVSGV